MSPQRRHEHPVPPSITRLTPRKKNPGFATLMSSGRQNRRERERVEGRIAISARW
jgi:hypothetical protein